MSIATLRRSRPSGRALGGGRSAFGVVILIAYLVPILFGVQSFTLGQYQEILALLVSAVALNLAMGVAGQQIIGITAVFAVGGYTAALMARAHPHQTSLIVMVVLGALAGGVGGLVIALPALRVGGFYLALVSIYAAMCVPAVGTYWNWAGGEAGIPLYVVPGVQPEITGRPLYWTFLTIVLLVTLLSWAIMHSPIGRRFVALRTSPELATSLGASGYRTKLLAIEIASLLAGASGGMYVYSQQFFSPSSASTNVALLLLAAIIIGGEGTVLGPIVGGVIVLGLNSFLTGFQDVTTAIFGGILLLCAVLMPRGMVDEAKNLVRWAVSRRRGRAAPSGPVRLTDGIPPAALAELFGPHEQDRTARPPLEVRDARRTFGGVAAVAGVDLTVEPGTVHGLIGSNGSGKTTLLNLISRFYTLDDGTVTIGDVHLESGAPYRVARAGVARTFQSPKLMLGATALENVLAGAELGRQTSGFESVFRLPRGIREGRAAERRARAALEIVGLESIADQEAGALPHGTRRLVEIARVLAVRPRFALLDEPAAGLSAAELDRLVEVITAMAESGVGVLLIEHNVPVVLDIASQVTVLHQGTCLFRGTPDQLRADPEVAVAFLGVEPAQLEAL